MKKYYDSVATTTGDAVSGASVTVYQYGTLTPASLFSDSTGTTPKANPITTDNTGYFEFYAADGRYSLAIFAVGMVDKTVVDVLLEDPADANPGVFTSITVSGAASIPALTSGITADANAALAAKIAAETAQGLAEDAQAAAQAAQTGAEAAYTSLAPYLTDISVVASVAVDVPTVADIAADVTVVAGISTDVTYVADNGPALLAAASDASGSATLAQAWATQLTTEVVAGQGYSAKQYALDAETHASYFEPAILSIGNDVVSTQAEIAELLAAQYDLAAQLAGLSVTTSNTVTFTNKTISLGSNTLTGTSVQMASAISDHTGSGALVFANGPTFTAPILGAATATSINGTTIPTSKTLVTTESKLSALAATTSAELRGVISDETGSGALVFGISPTLSGAKLTDGIVVSNTSGVGIKIDEATPVFGWRDIIGAVNPKSSGTGAPTRTVYDGGVVADYAFAANDLCDFVYHIPHDWAPGTDLLWHVHWSHNGTTSISGTVVFDFFYRIAKRDGVFGAEKQLTITYPVVNLTTTPRVKHFVHETPMTATVATATLSANSEIEVDGVIVGTLRMTTLPNIGGSGKLFIHTSDIHYQSTNLATRNNAPDFYA